MNRQTKEMVGAVSILAVLIAVLGVAVFFYLQFSQQQRLRAAQEAALALQAQEAPEPVEVDHFAALEDAARAMVTQKRVGASTIGARLEEGLLTQLVPMLRVSGVEEGPLEARRAHDSVYEVRKVWTYLGMEVGPRWLVQMNARGPSPEGSGGVVAANAMAHALATDDLGALRSGMGRSDEIVRALTEHRFESGARLGSALLVYFLGREDAQVAAENVHGWAVVPHQVGSNGEFVYRALFQWREGDSLQDALWEVSYSNGQPSFRARDQRADQIMSRGGEVREGEILDIRPESMRDLSGPPSREREPRRRALRYLLADERLVEAVGALLAFRAASSELEYVSWRVDFAEGSREQVEVSYLFRENGAEMSAAWTVNSRTGEREPQSEIAMMAEAVLSLPAPATPAGAAE